MKLRSILFEDPHGIEVQGRKQSAFNDFGEPGAKTSIAFLYLKDKLYMSEYNRSHSFIYDIIPDVKSPDTIRDEPIGRLFLKTKVISFWIAPEPEQLKKVIDDINKEATKRKYNFKINDSWVLDVKASNRDKYYCYDYNEVVIKINDYIHRTFPYKFIRPSFRNDTHIVE